MTSGLLTPAASTFINTSPSAASGTGIFTIDSTSGPPVFWLKVCQPQSNTHSQQYYSPGVVISTALIVLRHRVCRHNALLAFCINMLASRPPRSVRERGPSDKTKK
jgi:hypothetical protein